MDFFQQHYWIFVGLMIWSLPWKALALWRSAKNGQLAWFIAIFILNTGAILEIIYIFFFAFPEKEANYPYNNLSQNGKNSTIRV